MTRQSIQGTETELPLALQAAVLDSPRTFGEDTCTRLSSLPGSSSSALAPLLPWECCCSYFCTSDWGRSKELVEPPTAAHG